MEREEINERLSLLARRMEELKADIHTAITTSFTHFDSSFDTTTTLSEKVKALSEEMESLSLKINSEVCVTQSTCIIVNGNMSFITDL